MMFDEVKLTWTQFSQKIGDLVIGLVNAVANVSLIENRLNIEATVHLW